MSVKPTVTAFGSGAPLDGDDFTITMSLPKTDYRLMEGGNAVFTLNYSGSSEILVQWTAIGPFNLIISDLEGQEVFNWETANFSPWPVASPLMPPVKVKPGDSLTWNRPFIVAATGQLKVEGKRLEMPINVLKARQEASGFDQYSLKCPLPPILIVVTL